ncbi:MAG: winged helix-turn-helix domain-containing protein [Candidatus Omnitrophica bacterium]|nr:winged helix-turn-helix domain-containing protein [Candidatus Omnitrophota bacterium]
MITKIGIAAGEIWHWLEKHDQICSLEGMIKGLDKPRDMLLMSIGWLAREGHVVVEGEGPDYKVTLRK